MRTEVKETVTTGSYIYAITKLNEHSVNAKHQTLRNNAIGVLGCEVYSIPHGKVCAIVSDVPVKKIRPERRNLAAHQEVLKLFMKSSTILPTSFGIIADNRTAIEIMLRKNQSSFLSQLHKLDNCVELGLRITWDVPNIFEYFVNIHQELRETRDRYLGKHREPRQEDKMHLGRMFEQILQEDRNTHFHLVEEILSDVCTDLKCLDPRNENEVMNLACLIDREKMSEFEAAVFKASGLFDNNYTFDYNGPWAPHNFVDMNLQL